MRDAVIDRRRLLGTALTLATLASSSAWAAPRRLVSVGGAITETLFALGAQDELVGVDTTSVYPAAARALPSVGYARTLSAEGVLALRPTLLLASEEAGPPAVLRQLEAARLPVRVLDSYNPKMRRAFTAALLIIAMAFQALTGIASASPRDNLVDPAHAALHWQQEAHHHHDSGGYHTEDSDESTRHLMTDHASAPAVLPVMNMNFSRQDAAIPAALSARTNPAPYLEGLLRPPRPTV